MPNGAISDQSRLLAAVSELDATPAPATEVAARRLIVVADALVRSDLSGVCLGEGEGIGPHGFKWRPLTEVPLWSPSVRGREHPVKRPKT